MREIKFRAWNGSKMRYNVNINDGKPVREGYQWFDLGNDIHEAELMQFTGLQDKNGIDIYEGDKILYLGAKGEVYYYNDTCMFMVGFSTNRSAWSFDSMDSLIEVIGNTHE